MMIGCVDSHGGLHDQTYVCRLNAAASYHLRLLIRPHSESMYGTGLHLMFLTLPQVIGSLRVSLANHQSTSKTQQSNVH